MLRKSIYLSLTLGLSIAAFGCSSDPDDSPAPEPVEEPCDCGQPPEDPSGPAGDGDDVVLGISKLFLGDTDRNGNPDDGAWKSYGYNLDNFKSTNASKNLCKPRDNAKGVHQDGENGIDNAFGKGILAAIGALLDDPSSQVNDAIDSGKFTVMLKLDKLGTGKDYSNISASLFGGGNLEDTPKWDGTDEWPVLFELLENGDITKPKVKLNSYVNDRTWVGTANKLDLTVDISGTSLTLAINHAILSMDLDADNKGAKNGTIAGILQTDDLLASIKSVAGKFSADFCEGSTLDPILNQLAQSSDILSDGTQNPEKTCDGISIGLGFEAKAVQLGEVTEPSEGGEDKCQ